MQPDLDRCRTGRRIDLAVPDIAVCMQPGQSAGILRRDDDLQTLILARQGPFNGFDEAINALPGYR